MRDGLYRSEGGSDAGSGSAAAIVLWYVVLGSANPCHEMIMWVQTYALKPTK